MTNARRIGALAVFAALLAGCGGGGGGSSPVTPKTVASPAATTGKPIATASLTIKYSSNFHVAKRAAAATAASRAAAAATRKAAFAARKTAGTRVPAYINATYSFTLDIFVDGTDMPVTVNPGGQSNGTQTISIPLYSTAAHQIVAVESDGGISTSNAEVLAIGETDIPANSFSAGDAPVIGLTLLMNAATIGITSDTDNDNGDAQTGSGQWTFDISDCGSYPASGSVYLFAADEEDGFVDGNGAGLPTVNLTSWLTDPGASVANTLNGNSGVNPGYYLTFNSATGMTLNATVQNPAYPIYTDAAQASNAYYNDYPYDVFHDGTYPGIEHLYINGPLNSAISNIQSEGPSQSVSIDVDPDNEGC